MNTATIYVFDAALQNSMTLDKDWRLASFDAVIKTDWKKICDVVTYKRKTYQVFSVLERSGISRISVIYIEVK
jgi:DUF438 domain-containing protein